MKRKIFDVEIMPITLQQWFLESRVLRCGLASMSKLFEPYLTMSDNIDVEKFGPGQHLCCLVMAISLGQVVSAWFLQTYMLRIHSQGL